MIFYKYIKLEREKKYTSAKEFFIKNSLSCSYGYYQQVEQGKKLPRAEVAVEIVTKLDCDLKIGLFNWAKTQMPTSETKEIFSLLEDAPTLNEYFDRNQESMLVDRPKAKLIQKNPLYWELILYLNTSETTVSSKKLSKKFNITQDKITLLLEKLYEHSLIERTLKNKEYLYRTINNIHMPRDKDYDLVRSKNFSRSYSQFNKATQDKYQSTLTVSLSKNEAEEVMRKCIQLTLIILKSEDQNRTINTGQARYPYTLGLFWSKRIFGNNINE